VSRSGPSVAVDDTPSVAVLPFTNLSASAEDEYFSDGMTDEVINALARVPGIRVAARTSAFVFKGQRVDLRDIAQQLRVGTILEGSVRRAGNRVRISVQLVGAIDGLHLWSERYDRELADVFALQDEIAQAICRALEQRLGGAGGRGRSGPQELRRRATDRAVRAPVDPAVYDLFLRGRFLFEQHAAVDAIACFERVVAMDPEFAPAYGWLACAHMLAANLNLLPPLVAYPRGRAAADRALELEPNLPVALLARGAIAVWFDWDQPRGEALLREVVALAPGWANGHEILGWTLISGDRLDEGVRSMERARALDPLSDFMLWNVASALLLAGQTTRAIDLVRPAVERASGNGALHLVLGTALYLAGRLAEARAALERGRELTPAGAQLRGSLICVLAAMGEHDAARDRLDEVREHAERGTGSAIEVACGYVGLGEDELAYAWLERACEVRTVWMTWLHIEPRFKRLQGTPRFEALLQRVSVEARAGAP
jgi:TolB-like protein